MKGMLSWRKCISEKIGANLAHIQAENLQNVQKMTVDRHIGQHISGIGFFTFYLKMCFWQKSPGVNGLKMLV